MIVAKTGREVFQAMQKIVIQHTDDTVKGPMDIGVGVPVDVRSAAMVIQVHEVLGEANQAKMMEMFEMRPIAAVVDVLWKCANAGQMVQH